MVLYPTCSLVGAELALLDAWKLDSFGSQRYNGLCIYVSCCSVVLARADAGV